MTVLNIRMSVDEKLEIKERAELSGQTISSYARDLLFFVDNTEDEKDNTNIITNDILLDLMQNIKRLENRLDKIEKNTKDNTKVITKRNIKNNIGYMNIKNTKDTTTKSIRLYTEVKAELDKYIEEHKEVKVIDIVSFAILEYINKNK